MMKNSYIPYKVKVSSFKRETRDTFILKLEDSMQHEPGQFIQVSLPGIGEAPISISSYSEKYIELSIREIGNVTRALSKLKPGDYVWIRGPYGNGYPMKQLRGNSIVIIGGGCGVASLKGIIEYIYKNRKDYKDIILFLGYRSPDDILYKKEMKKWKFQHILNLTVDAAPKESCYTGTVGFITQSLDNYNLDNANKVVFICGPPVMINKSIEILKKKGFHEDQIFLSAERLMYCGIGRCCHCMIHGKFTCQDGPVFRYDSISGYKND